MKFYHCFFTDLPDQFVEANSDRLVKWADGWKDKNRYYRRSMIVDTVAIDFFGNTQKEAWPRLKAQSKVMIDNWMAKKGQNYNGGYWGTLTEDQRDPNRVSGIAWGIDPAAGTYGAGPAPALTAASLIQAARWLSLGDIEERSKPPLKRDGMIAGEIVGYRCWRIECGLLRSVYQSDVWKPGEILAGRELGDWDQRGIHAWKDSGSKHYHDYIRSYLNRSEDMLFMRVMMWGRNADEKQLDPRPAMVTGTVFLWGDVVEHERGYRAEYARVRSLDWLYPDASMMGREAQTLSELRHRYTLTSPIRGAP